MSRYIDFKELERRINENVKIPRYWSYEQRETAEWCKDECIRQGYCIPTADVVPRDQAVQLEHDVMCLMKENSELRKRIVPSYCKIATEEEAIEIGRKYGKIEVAKEIFEEIEKILSDNFHADCQMGDCIEDYYDDNLRDDIAELKKKYTEGAQP